MKEHAVPHALSGVRLAPGWLACLGESKLALCSPQGREWEISFDSGDASAILGLLEDGVSHEYAENEFLETLRSVGALRNETYRGASEDLIDGDVILECFVYREAPEDAGQSVEAEGFAINNLESDWDASTLVLLVDQPLNDELIAINSKIISQGRQALLVAVNGWNISLGPVVEPSQGGPCLLCIRERWLASLLSALKWSPVEKPSAVAYGVEPPAPGATHLAIKMARDLVYRLSKKELVASRMLTQMNRISLVNWEMSRFDCHPLPWCAACSEPLGKPPLIHLP